MPVTVVVGGQYGSEGKGKVCAHLALTGEADIVVRCGGPNSGHTADQAGVVYELKQVPTGFVNPMTRLLIAAGAIINPKTLLHEIEVCGLDSYRIGIDANAAIIEESDVLAESSGDLRLRLGSTSQGVGAAVARRVARDPNVRLAKDVPELKGYITSVSDELAIAVREAQKIVVEGTQGFGRRAHTKLRICEIDKSVRSDSTPCRSANEMPKIPATGKGKRVIGIGQHNLKCSRPCAADIYRV